MAFESLSEKLQNVFKNLRSKGRTRVSREYQRILPDPDGKFRYAPSDGSGRYDGWTDQKLSWTKTGEEGQ